MKNTTLIPISGESPLFHDKKEKDYTSINARTFSDKLRYFEPIQNFKFVWEKAAQYLQKIAEVKDFRKMRTATLKVASEDLDFNKVQEVSLDDKIKNNFKATKSSLSSLKPKMKQ